jgi:hypothetical protein
MTESEYKQLPQFRNLPLYDEGDPLASTLELPGKGDTDGTIWLAMHEATDLKAAQEHLKDSKLVAKGGIRFWNSNRMDFDVFAYFWEKRQS